VIFVDSNIPMYLVGAEHPNKDTARRLVERNVARHDRLVTDVEVLQEILQRYAAIGRRQAIQPAFDVLLAVVDEVFSIQLADAQRARALVLGPGDLSARDALHVAVMERHGIEYVMTFDSGFDRVSGIHRVAA
jgi:uncharacterized protein